MGHTNLEMKEANEMEKTNKLFIRVHVRWLQRVASAKTITNGENVLN